MKLNELFKRLGYCIEDCRCSISPSFDSMCNNNIHELSSFVKMETKICSGKHGCGRELSVKMFYKHKGGWYDSYCKPCSSKAAVERKRKNPPRDINAGKKTRICSGKHGCSRELPINYFTKNRYMCKLCDSAYNQLRRLRNPKLHKKSYTKSYHELGGKEKMKIYRSTEIGRKKVKINSKKFYKRHPTYRDDRMRMERENLTDNYIKASLKSHNIHDPSPELMQAKRLQLLLYRKLKHLKDEQRKI